MSALAAIDSRVVTALIVAGGLLLFGALLVITAAGELRGRRKAKVPPAMRPAPSDEELEHRVITRILAWGAAATLLMAIWLPSYWLREEHRKQQKAIKFENLAVHGPHGGEHLYDEFCLSCHGAEGTGTIQTIGTGENEQQYVEPPLKFIYDRYRAAGLNEDEVTQLIYDAINRGRPGTPMPTWALAFGGPFNTFQVDSVVAYIQSIQEEFEPPEVEGSGVAAGRELFEELECSVCHGVNGTGRDRQGRQTVGPNLTVALQRLTLDEVRQTIEEGRINMNRPSMPAWAFIGEDAVSALVAYIESIQRS